MGAALCTNCLASASIGILLCCHGCNAEWLRNSFTFAPPRPSYAVERDPSDGDRRRLAYRMDVLCREPFYIEAATCAEVQWLLSRSGSMIPIVWVRAPNQHDENSTDGSGTTGLPSPRAPTAGHQASSLVILFCHGNATDIGMMMGPFYELVRLLGVEVVGVEYTGYGVAEGEPSVSNTIADLEAVYEHLTGAGGIAAERIVAYGQSVGSGPVCYLASKYKLGGLILHSPMLSGIKVIDPKPDNSCRPSCVCTCFDFFPNDRRVRSTRCPVLVMHGVSDEVIPFYHGERLHAACPQKYRWRGYFPRLAGHNDLPETDKHGYYREVAAFLEDVRKLASGRHVDAPVGLLQTTVSAARSRETLQTAVSTDRSARLRDFLVEEGHGDHASPAGLAVPDDDAREIMLRLSVSEALDALKAAEDEEADSDENGELDSGRTSEVEAAPARRSQMAPFDPFGAVPL